MTGSKINTNGHNPNNKMGRKWLLARYILIVIIIVLSTWQQRNDNSDQYSHFNCSVCGVSVCV